MKVKICGVTTAEDACHAAACGADAIGFVFAQSKRQITAIEAGEIIGRLPKDVWKVGVFVNEAPDKIKQIAEMAGLTHIQLHGEEAAADYKSIGLPLIKAGSIRPGKDIHDSCTGGEADYILLDSPPEKYRGGNGVSFDWNQAHGFGNSFPNIILAGGLNPGNVQEAIEKVSPFMVDVSSGVETNGRKDALKIQEFIISAKD
ncbi:phosphoribosylanthranilate isomerase [Mesobacillus subterraneus]|uniref:N-(5'-phosphoribosyl)anthranilate isomerase n=1 Tax=Mesobacillus subterraneus TaxID=285983 RepID=A0A3R9DSA5_9BACI|nr:phosphoribosylanthranilate isomerase [Mesobacillus subterraneus]RSD26199.1 phosphoribosylanthranilate isomerase [Mesobacillus subterraneus]